MPDQKSPRPPDRRQMGLRRRSGIECLLPLALELTPGYPDRSQEGVDRCPGIDELGQNILSNRLPLRQDHLKVVRRMEGKPVVPGVAGLKQLKIQPAEEGKNPAEDDIQALVLKNRSVAQFMHGIRHKGHDGAVKENQAQRHPPGPMVEGIGGGSRRGHENTEVAQRLESPLEIAFFMERFHVLLGKLCPVPVDDGAFSFAAREFRERFFLRPQC